MSGGKWILDLIQPLDDELINKLIEQNNLKALNLTQRYYNKLKENHRLGLGKHHYCLIHTSKTEFIIVAKNYTEKFQHSGLANDCANGKPSLQKALKFARSKMFSRYDSDIKMNQSDDYGFIFNTNNSKE